MNPLVANERFRYFGADFDRSVFEIQRQMASWSRQTGRSNEGPYLAARGGNEFGQFFCWYSASNHSGDNRFRIRQFYLIVHTFFWLAIATAVHDQRLAATAEQMATKLSSEFARHGKQISSPSTLVNHQTHFRNRGTQNQAAQAPQSPRTRVRLRPLRERIPPCHNLSESSAFFWAATAFSKSPAPA